MILSSPVKVFLEGLEFLVKAVLRVFCPVKLEMWGAPFF